MIVRWGLDALQAVCDEAGVEWPPLLVASPRWNLPIAPVRRWSEVPSDRIEEAAAQAERGVIAIGGGSAIDLGKALDVHAGLAQGMDDPGKFTRAIVGQSDGDVSAHWDEIVVLTWLSG